ncbi:MAG: thiamine pyrophosphate-binding protein [Armatimonadota bacterium]
MTTAADALVATLRAHGVRLIFGHPGNHTIPIYEALRTQQDAVRHLLVRHEQAAGFAADGLARSTGAVGVLVTTAGPGATNALTAVATAYSDCVPLLCLTAQVHTDRHLKHAGAYHDLDLLAVFAPATKWNAAPDRPGDVPALVAEALKIAQTPPPGPVHLDLPEDILDAEVDVSIPDPLSIPRPAARPHQLAAAAGLLLCAERPLLLVGGGVVSAGACGELAALARALGAPVATTCMGKGAIPASHPLSLGVTQGGRCTPAFEQADLLLAAGCRFGQVSTRGWSLPLPDKSIHVDADPRIIGATFQPTLGLVADARLVLRELLSEARGTGTRRAPWFTLPEAPPERPEGREAAYQAINDGLREALDPTAIVCLDVCMPAYRMISRFEVEQPRSLLYPATYIAMGYGLPAAIGAKLANPDRQVAVVCGDGGFMMTAHELATAVAEGLAVPIVLYNDESLTSVASTHRRRHDGHTFGTDLTNPDFVALARAFGAQGERLEDPADLPDALQRALASRLPYLIEMHQPATPS